MKLRVTYLEEKELENFREGMKLIYDIHSESSCYPMRNSKYRRKYFEISIKEEKLEHIKSMMEQESCIT